jgi:hypothetical protein
MNLINRGAYYCEFLEYNAFTNYSKWNAKLFVDGKPICGFGMATFHELKHHGLIVCYRSNRWQKVSSAA